MRKAVLYGQAKHQSVVCNLCAYRCLIQPGRTGICGVNRKIEGFFDVCRLKGLTGEQGVLVPRANLKNLMLRRDVVKAVEGGEFHIYAVGSIDEGIEVLTGVPAGQRDSEGLYPASSVNGLVEKQLQEYSERLKRFTAPESKKEGAEEEE